MKLRLFVFLPVLTGACLSQKIDDFIAGLEVTTSGTTGTSTGEGSSSSSDETSGAAADSAGETSSGGLEGTATGSTSSAASSSGSTSSESSGDGPPVCGDGEVEGDEECDDGNQNPDDGCSDSCAVDLRVFVTSEIYKAYELKSTYFADAKCLNRAKDAGLPNYTRFKAWLSDSDEDARDRFNRDRRGRLVMVNGLVLAADWEALLAGQLENPLEVTETSTTYHGKVWTGTKANGTAAVGTNHCMDWSSNSIADSAYYGYSDEISFEWTLADQIDNPLPCIDPLAIYCFESF